jgi:hypothetical protein
MVCGAERDQFFSLAYVLSRRFVSRFYNASLRGFEFHLHLHGLDHGHYLSGLDSIADGHRQRDQVAGQRGTHNRARFAVVGALDTPSCQTWPLALHLNGIDLALYLDPVFSPSLFDKDEITGVIQTQGIEWQPAYLLQIHVQGLAIYPYQMFIVHFDFK